jgi:alkylation response protein AidB-like acyl-CoA dehydrogenase
MDDLVALARARGLDRDEGVRRRIAQIYADMRAQSLVAVRVSNAMAAGKLNHGHGGMLKVGGDTLQQRRAEFALSLAGSSGIAWREGDLASEWSHSYLSSRSASIAGGTDEIQRNNVSERALGLPREPSVDRDIPFNEVLRN